MKKKWSKNSIFVKKKKVLVRIGKKYETTQCWSELVTNGRKNSVLVQNGKKNSVLVQNGKKKLSFGQSWSNNLSIF